MLSASVLSAAVLTFQTYHLLKINKYKLPVIVIIRLMLSLLVWSKVITLSGFHCTYNLRKLQRFQIEFKKSLDSNLMSFWLTSFKSSSCSCFFSLIAILPHTLKSSETKWWSHVRTEVQVVWKWIRYVENPFSNRILIEI